MSNKNITRFLLIYLLEGILYFVANYKIVQILVELFNEGKLQNQKVNILIK